MERQGVERGVGGSVGEVVVVVVGASLVDGMCFISRKGEE